MALSCLMLAAAPATAACRDETVIRNLTREALDEAFKLHVETLFSVWMREHAPGHADRVKAGIDKAINAYIKSRRDIDNWKCQ